MRYARRRRPFALPTRPLVLATCCVVTYSALENAAQRAKIALTGQRSRPPSRAWRLVPVEEAGATGADRRSGCDPVLGLLQLIQPVDLDFAGGHPGEHPVRL